MAAGYVIAGHIHPGVRLRGAAREHARLPCFWFGAGGAVLHPTVRPFADPAALSAAYQAHAIVPLPSNAAALGLVIDPAMGTGAKVVGAGGVNIYDVRYHEKLVMTRSAAEALQAQLGPNKAAPAGEEPAAEEGAQEEEAA